MLQDTKLAFIGTGIMAEAMIKGLVTQGLVSPDHIIGSDPHLERGQELHVQYGIRFTADNHEAADFGEIVVLSVKPQVLPHVLPELRGHLSRSSLILSIVAGRALVRSSTARAIRPSCAACLTRRRRWARV